MDSLALAPEKREQFWTTFCVVLVIHAAFIAGVVSVSRWLFQPLVVEQITWLDAGPISGAEEIAEPEPPAEVKPPEPELSVPQPQVPSDFTEITPTPTPKPTPKPTTPRPKETPKPTKAKTTPRPTPRTNVAERPPVSRPAEPRVGASGTNTQDGSKANGAAGGTGTNAAIAADMNRYRELVQLRFGSLWEQPVVGVDAGGGAQMGIIHFRVSANGTVTSARLSKSSGSSLMDDSLNTLCNRIKSLPPPPASIAPNGFFENIIEMRLTR